MFTGIVTDVGRIRLVAPPPDSRIEIETAYDTAAIALGASIACSGVCLTVVDRGPGWFAVQVSAETRARTAPDRWREGARLNLERALRVGDELGGHIVTGHVDGVGEVLAIAPDGASHRVTIVVPRALAPNIAPKGSITVDGVSLTVNEVSDDGRHTGFGVNIIPHTRTHTTLEALAPGSHVNLEIDILSRYLARLLEARVV
ncbi:MAG: riboflavin synthase [Sphingomonadaceae bacterium]|nr:riboflavin synthase [Sphingomonadaceae bacterium]